MDVLGLNLANTQTTPPTMTTAGSPPPAPTFSAPQVMDAAPSHPMRSPPMMPTGPFELSPQYAHYCSSPGEFRVVIANKMARLQNTLANLGTHDLRQARADLVYLRAVLEERGETEARRMAEEVWEADV